MNDIETLNRVTMDELYLSSLSSKQPSEEVKLKMFKEELYNMFLTKNTNKVTEMITHYLKDKYVFKSIRNDKDEEIWVYVDGIYIPNGKSYIQENTRMLLHVAYTTYLCNQVINKIYADTLIDQDLFFNNQNNYPYLLPLQNGVLDISKMKLLNFSSEYYFFNKINASYKPLSKCNNIIKFIRSIVGTEDDVKTIQEMIGFTLLREYRFEKGFMLFGEQGRNGKSKLLSLIQYLLGASNCSNVSLHEIEKDPFSLINFHNKLVNISADLSKEAISNTGTYKSLTGRDVINANRKGRSYLQFVNYAKMIFASNELPLIHTFSKAYWLRWVVIDFPFQFLPQHEINSMEDKRNCFVQDTEILNKLTSEEELNGLLLWSLEGLDRLIQTNKFSNEKNSSKVYKYWLRKSNSVSAFIEDCVDIDFDVHITKQNFRKAYHEYCITNNLNQMSDKAVKITMSNELGITEQRIFEGNERNYCWEGIKLKSNLHKKETEIILSELEKNETMSFKDFKLIVNNDSVLAECLNKLEKQGDIIELPKGKWRKIK